MQTCYRSILGISVFCYTLCGQEPPPTPVPTPTPVAVPTPTPTAIPTPPPSANTPTSAPATNGCQPGELYMPDGQIASHTIRVFLARNIQLSQDPKLELRRSHAVTEQDAKNSEPRVPMDLSSGQTWNESKNDQNVVCSGTLLMFDLSNLDFQYKPMVRVLPVLHWKEGGVDQPPAVAPNEVNVGNIVWDVIWTLLVVFVTLLFIVLIARTRKTNPLLLLSGVDGHLALSQTQIACWTIAVGGVVLGYGLIKQEIPDIPTSLLALMGASLATGGIGFFQDSRKQTAAENAGVQTVCHDMSLGDLVRNFPAGQDSELSLAKAQMIFWTVLLLILFIGKSMLDGVIWDVPWPLVALMGFSQAGYLAPKLTPEPPPQPVQPAPQPAPVPAPQPVPQPVPQPAPAPGQEH